MDSLLRAQDYSLRYRADVTSHGGAEALITAFDTQTVVEVQSLAAIAGGQRLRRRMNHELNFPPNFGRLVLGCIDADFCKYILVGELSPRSTQCTPLHRFGIHNRKLGKTVL